jgi:carboxypeptidase family protein
MPYVRFGLISPVLLLLTVTLAVAQDATLTGDVADSSGGAVPGASVVLRNAGATSPVETITDSAGTFRFPPARSGAYDLSVTLPGFSPFTLRGLRLEVGERRNVHVKLEVSQLEETITVAATTPLGHVAARMIGAQSGPAPTTHA